MSNPLDIDKAVNCLRTLVDNIRCGICDKLEGFRKRYPCGHTACDDCVATASCCLLCFSTTTAREPVFDDPITQRIKSTSNLKTTFENLFNIDVYKRHRLSEQLKVEKELFPECIQAPIKYGNKRKSLNVKYKEKRHILPGEQISPFKKLEMEKTAYIQQWLEQSEKKRAVRSPRKVFADLNVNDLSLSTKQKIPKKRVDHILNKVQRHDKETMKQRTSHFKITPSIDRSPLKRAKQNTFGRDMKRLKNGGNQTEKAIILGKTLNKDNNDESGIVIDDEPIIIDDSQNGTIDKDKEAWLAVLKADENVVYNSSQNSFRLECSEVMKYTDDIQNKTKTQNESFFSECNKVPFLKKSYLYETCKSCDIGSQTKQTNTKCTPDVAMQSKDVSITIESMNFITTIEVSKTVDNTSKVINKHFTSVQTDINGSTLTIDHFKLNYKDDKVEHLKKCIYYKQNENDIQIQSQDLFTGEDYKTKEPMQKPSIGQIFGAKETKPLVIAGSDSDDDVNESKIIEVTADVHRSSDQVDYGVLNEVDENKDLQSKRQIKRRATPGSTDSSEKENYDPNRIKRKKLNKKTIKKNSKRKHLDVIKSCTIK